jgi:hypothetical protein
MVENLGEVVAQSLDALRDHADLPLELGLVTVQRGPLDVDHAAQAADEVDQGVEPFDRLSEVVVRVGERRSDLGDARLESAQKRSARRSALGGSEGPLEMSDTSGDASARTMSAERGLTAVAARVAESLTRERAGSVQGLHGPARAAFLAALYQHSPRPILVVAADARAAEPLAQDLHFFLGEEPGGDALRKRVHVLPGWDVAPFSPMSPSPRRSLSASRDSITSARPRARSW